jgi:Cys-tRNA synthase (O-phospho-L-seryl-tRNA:Cys-tRNA synthase)
MLHILYIIIEYIKILTKKAKDNRRLSMAIEDQKGIQQLSIHPKERDLRLIAAFS